MLKKLIAVWLLALPAIGHSQVTLNAQLPPAGLVQKDRLWDLILVNNSADVLELTVQMNLQDAKTGQVVLSANSGSLLLGKGVKLTKASDLQPISYTYGLADFARTYIPMGTYIACYRLFSNGGRTERPIGEECIRINIDPLSPPLLNTPADRSSVESPYPQFTWMPPTPFEMFSSLNYDLLLTEVLPGQSPTEAIQYNSPLYSKNNITQTFESYASSFTKLDTGKLYAWQVIAKNDLNYAAKTEVWTFKIAGPSWITLLIEQTPFVKMQMNSLQKGIAPNGILKLAYINESPDTSVRIHLTAMNNPGDHDVFFDVKIRPGENLIQQNLKKVFAAKPGIVYEAYIINSRNEKWKMLFEVKEYKDKKAQRN